MPYIREFDIKIPWCYYLTQSLYDDDIRDGCQAELIMDQYSARESTTQGPENFLRTSMVLSSKNNVMHQTSQLCSMSKLINRTVSEWIYKYTVSVCLKCIMDFSPPCPNCDIYRSCLWTSQSKCWKFPNQIQKVIHYWSQWCIHIAQSNLIMQTCLMLHDYLQDLCMWQRGDVHSFACI